MPQVAAGARELGNRGVGGHRIRRRSVITRARFGYLVTWLLILAAPCAAWGLSVEAIAPDTVRGIIRSIEPAEGAIWAASDQGVYRIERGGQSVARFSTGDALPSNTVYSVSAHKGKVYAGTDRGLAVLSGTRWTTIDRIGNVRLARFVYTAVDPAHDALYVCSVYVSGGLLRYDGAEWTFLGGEGYGLFNNVVSFGFTDNEVWLGTLDGVIYRMAGKQIDHFRSSDGFPGSRVHAIRTAGGTVYAATDRGVAVFEGGRWRSIDVSAAAGSREVYSLALTGATVFAGGPKGIVRIAGNTVSAVEDPSGRLAGGVFSLAFVDGALYAGTRDGLVVVKGLQ